jgi:hypothetical protein
MHTKKLTLGLLALTLSLASCGPGNPVPVTAPGNPTTFTATATNSTAVLLNWSAVPDASNFTLERKTNGGAYAVVAPSVPGNTLSYSDTALTPSTAYTYRLKAVNSAGTSSGVERDVTTPAPGNPEFTLSAQPTALTVTAGRSGSAQIGVTRPANPEGGVTLSLEGASAGSGPSKIQGAFGGAGGTLLMLNVGAEVPVGPHTLTVRGKNGSIEKTVQLTVNVERWAIVDDDDSSNNSSATNPASVPDSVADKAIRAAMNAADRPFDVFVVPHGTGGYEPDIPDGPSATQLSKYSGVVYYSGSSFATAMTNDDLASMGAFVDAPGRKLILLSSAVLRNSVGGRNQLQVPDERFRPLLVTRAGLAQTASGETIAMPAYTLTGQANTVMQGLNVPVAARSFRSYMTPAAGTQTLFRENDQVIATGRAATGASGSSKVIVAGFEINGVAQADANALLGRLLNF